jgi:peptidoglycan/LPS O-acetylase OafA/YrhL
MILTAVGFAALNLNRKSAALAWLNRKIFPLYIVHQTIIIAALFYILPLEAGVAAKMSLVLVATISGSLALCLLFEQLPWPFRALVGLPEQPVGAPAPETSTVPLRY